MLAFVAQAQKKIFDEALGKDNRAYLKRVLYTEPSMHFDCLEQIDETDFGGDSAKAGNARTALAAHLLVMATRWPKISTANLVACDRLYARLERHSADAAAETVKIMTVIGKNYPPLVDRRREMHRADQMPSLRLSLTSFLRANRGLFVAYAPEHCQAGKEGFIRNLARSHGRSCSDGIRKAHPDHSRAVLRCARIATEEYVSALGKAVLQSGPEREAIAVYERVFETTMDLRKAFYRAYDTGVEKDASPQATRQSWHQAREAQLRIMTAALDDLRHYCAIDPAQFQRGLS